MLRNEKDLMIIELKLQGKRNTEISQTSGVPLKTVQNLVARGGRLHNKIQETFQQRSFQTQEIASLALQKTKEEVLPGIERMKALAQDSSNGPVCYKANEFLLGLAGLSPESTLRSLLKSLSYDRALDKVNEAFLDIYGKSCIGSESSQEIRLSAEDVKRLEKIVYEMKILREQRSP